MTPVLYAPASVLDRAAVDPASPEGLSMKTLMRNLANWHSGEQSYMILPSDVSEGSNSQKAFEVKLLGIEGGGKQFDTNTLISERQKAILNCFGAAFILLGQEGVGSYALSDTQKSMHGFYVEKDINYICEVINRELIPQLLALNEIYLEDEDMPRLTPAALDESDADLASKAIQRATAVSAVPVHPAMVNEVLSKLGYEYRVPDDVLEDNVKWEEWSAKYMPNAISRSGDGMTSAGEGTSTSAMGQDDADAGNLDS